MKRLSLSFLFLSLVLAVSAQLRWDVKGGMSVANMTQMENAKLGYTVGIGVDYAFNDMFSLQSGVNFTSKGTREVDYEDDYYMNYDKETFKVMSHYVEIPVLAAVKFPVMEKLKVVLNAGPYFAVGIAGKEEFSHTAFTDYNYSYNLFTSTVIPGQNTVQPAMMKRFDTGLQFGVGTEINDHFLINMTGQCGFITPYNHPYNIMYGDDGKSPKNLCFMLTAGYRF